MVSSINGIRFSGLASGLDTESMIKQLMQAERAPLNKLNQKKQILTWQREAYREINTKLLELRNLAFDMKLQSNYISNKVVSSHESIVKASGTTSAPQGVHTVVVKQIATGFSVTSGEAIEKSRNEDGTIKSLNEQFGGTLPETLKIKITTNDDTNKIIELNTGEDTIYTLIKKLNEVGKSEGFVASYDENVNRVFINSTSTGESAKLLLEDVSEYETDQSGDFIKEKLKLFENGEMKKGQDAIVVFNGTQFKMSSNQFTINGINFDLQNADQNVTVQLNVTRDTSMAFDNIVKFINKYNEIIDMINTKISEKKYYDYTPLTDEQKKDMTEKQIELWEEKAKSGLLRGDTILSSLVSQLRTDFSSSVKGLTSEIDSMFDIGLNTGDYTQKGKIIIDENKLKDALAKDFEGVMKLFTTTNDSDYSSRGIADRVYKALSNTFKQITDKAGTAGTQTNNDLLGKALRDVEDRIDQMEARLLKVENRYWAQFTAMEKAIQQANSQSSWLAQYFSY